MKRNVCLAILLAALPVTPAVAGLSDWLPWNWGDSGSADESGPRKETMQSPDLPGFVVAHEMANNNQSIREEVPKGQTAQNWTPRKTAGA